MTHKIGHRDFLDVRAVSVRVRVCVCVWPRLRLSAKNFTSTHSAVKF